MILSAPADVLFGGHDDPIAHRRDDGDMTAVVAVGTSGPGLSGAVEVAPDQDVAGNRRLFRAVGIHHIVRGMIAVQPESGRVAAVTATPVVGIIAKRPCAEALDEFGTLERPTVAVAARLPRR